MCSHTLWSDSNSPNHIYSLEQNVGVRRLPWSGLSGDGLWVGVLMRPGVLPADEPPIPPPALSFSVHFLIITLSRCAEPEGLGVGG